MNVFMTVSPHFIRRKFWSNGCAKIVKKFKFGVCVRLKGGYERVLR